MSIRFIGKKGGNSDVKANYKLSSFESEQYTNFPIANTNYTGTIFDIDYERKVMLTVSGISIYLYKFDDNFNIVDSRDYGTNPNVKCAKILKYYEDDNIYIGVYRNVDSGTSYPNSGTIMAFNKDTLTLVNQKTVTLYNSYFHKGTSTSVYSMVSIPNTLEFIVYELVGVSYYFAAKFKLNSTDFSSMSGNRILYDSAASSFGTSEYMKCFCTDNGRYIIAYAKSTDASGKRPIYILERTQAYTYTTIYSNKDGSILTRPVILDNEHFYLDGKVYEFANPTVPILTKSISRLNSTTNYAFHFSNYAVLVENASVYMYYYDSDSNDLIEVVHQLPFNAATTYYDNKYLYVINARNLVVLKAGNSNVIESVDCYVDNKKMRFYNTNDTNVTTDKMLLNTSAFNNTGLIKGTMANNGALSYTPSTSQQTIPEGYTSGGTIAAIEDENLIPENIKSGVTILGITGTYEG